METRSYLTPVDGLRIHERRAGSGRAVVFVHGLAVSSRYFVPLLRTLATKFDCRALDLPGFGLSDAPSRTLGVGDLADALVAWLRCKGLEHAALAGNSSGCQYIVDAVARHPELTGPVVLMGPTTDASARTAPAQIGRWLRTCATADAMQLPNLLRDTFDAGVARIAGTLNAVLDDAIEDKLPAVAQPALVVRGSKDPLVPRPWAVKVVETLPQGRVVEVPGGAHVVHFTRPALVGQALTRFLEEVGYR